MEGSMKYRMMVTRTFDVEVPDDVGTAEAIVDFVNSHPYAAQEVDDYTEIYAETGAGIE
jgi:hypothetical protein